MALNAGQKARLYAVLYERFARDPRAVADELYLGFFETAAQRTTRAQGWLTVVRAQKQADRDAADAANTAYKAALDADLATLDAITSNV